MAEQGESILSLIDSGDWSSALFTTFTLSLTYLESHVLPHLRKRRCQRLTVLSDVAGYRDSLMEQRARSIGRDYSVVPVHVQGGIFHPKVVHLRAREGDEDLLLVGSGNLTYPGHGGNVEVLEALVPSRHAVAFQQAADFFDLLVATSRISMADPAAAAEAATRLRELAGRGTNAEDVQFVHSLDRSGLDQLLAVAKASDARWDELLVLSPYHHPSGHPVQRLLDELDIKRLAVGVSTKQREGSAFPYHEFKSLGLKQVRSVAPVTPKGPNRGLHAKWFELRGPGGALTLTGSFNATTESIETTHNVECGVLRRLAKSSDEIWQEVPEAPYVRSEFPQREDAQLNHCLFASFDHASALTGNLMGSGDFAGSWQARLETAEAILANGTVTVDAGGEFKWEDACKVDEVTAGTLQLTLTCTGMQARGWVQVSRILSLPAAERALLQALGRMSVGGHSQDDSGTVLDYIASHTAALMDVAPPVNAPTVAGGHGGPSDGDERTLTAAQFEALQDPHAVPGSYDGGQLLGHIGGGHRGWDLLRHVCAALMALPKAQRVSGQARGSWASSAGGNSRSEKEAGEPPGKGQDALEKQLAKANDEFSQRLQEATRQAQQPLTAAQREAVEVGKSRVLLMWSWVVLRFGLLELDQVEETQGFLWRRWLREVCDLRLGPTRKGHLDQQVCGVASACALWLLELPKQASNLVDTPEQVHRLLDQYFGGETPQNVREQARAWLEVEPGRSLVQGRAADAVEALDLVLSQRTERQWVKCILSGELGRPQTEELRLLGDARVRVILGAVRVGALRQVLTNKASGRQSSYSVDRHTLGHCPRCYHDYHTQRGRRGAQGPLQVNSELLLHLKRFGMVQCPHCNAVLLDAGL